MKLKKTKISQYFSDPVSHYKAVNAIAAKRGLSPHHVNRIIMSFFGKHGMKWFLMRKMSLKINNLGEFYFHKKTVEAYESKERKYRKRFKRYRNKYK